MSRGGNASPDLDHQVLPHRAADTDMGSVMIPKLPVVRT